MSVRLASRLLAVMTVWVGFGMAGDGLPGVGATDEASESVARSSLVVPGGTQLAQQSIVVNDRRILDEAGTENRPMIDEQVDGATGSYRGRQERLEFRLEGFFRKHLEVEVLGEGRTRTTVRKAGRGRIEYVFEAHSRPGFEATLRTDRTKHGRRGPIKLDTLKFEADRILRTRVLYDRDPPQHEDKGVFELTGISADGPPEPVLDLVSLLFAVRDVESWEQGHDWWVLDTKGNDLGRVQFVEERRPRKDFKTIEVLLPESGPDQSTGRRFGPSDWRVLRGQVTPLAGDDALSIKGVRIWLSRERPNWPLAVEIEIARAWNPRLILESVSTGGLLSASGNGNP